MEHLAVLLATSSSCQEVLNMLSKPHELLLGFVAIVGGIIITIKVIYDMIENVWSEKGGSFVDVLKNNTKFIVAYIALLVAIMIFTPNAISTAITFIQKLPDCLSTSGT